MTHRDRAGDAGHRAGRREAAGDAGASPRHALLAENLGKPSLWVIIIAPGYKETDQGIDPLEQAQADSPLANCLWLVNIPYTAETLAFRPCERGSSCSS